MGFPIFFIRPVYSARLHRMARSIFASVSGSVTSPILPCSSSIPMVIMRLTDKVDMRGIINELLRQGRIDGFIPLDELQRICKEYSLSTEKFEEVKLKIQAANIDLV